MGLTVKERFERYAYIDGKIRDLEEDIRKLYGRWTGLESVQASYTESPWTSHSVPVQGYDGELYNREKIEELQSQKNRWREEKRKIAQMVDNIPDLRTQRVIRLRYIEGMAAKSIAANIGDSTSEENVRKIIQRFFQKCHECHVCPETV